MILCFCDLLSDCFFRAFENSFLLFHIALRRSENTKEKRGNGIGQHIRAAHGM